MHTRGGAYVDKTLQSAAGATGEGQPLPLLDVDEGALEHVAVQVTGTFTATITWQVTVDGTNWVNAMMTPTATGTAAATATAAGVYLGNFPGCKAFRANITAFTSGAITAYAVAAA